MAKTPTPEDRRAARQAEIAEQARRQAEAAREDAQLNAPILADLVADVAALGELAARLKARTADLIPVAPGFTTFAQQVDTLATLHRNLDTIGAALVEHGEAVIAATDAAAQA